MFTQLLKGRKAELTWYAQMCYLQGRGKKKIASHSLLSSITSQGKTSS